MGWSVEKWEMKNWQRADTQKVEGNGDKKRNLGRVEEEWRKRATDRMELETADKERNDRKVAGKKTMKTEIMVNSPFMTGMPRNQQQLDAI